MSHPTAPALTTVFTPAASCLASIFATASGSAVALFLGPSSTANCLPSGWAPTPTFFFSPGFCPTGYTIASSTVSHAGVVSETAAICCPSGYSNQDGINVAQLTGLCSSALTLDANTQLTLGTKTLSSGTFNVNAYSVQVRWQSTDAQIVQFLATATSTTAPVNNSSDASNLPLAAKLSIGVGAALLCVVLSAITTCICIRRRRRARADANVHTPDTHASPEVATSATRWRAAPVISNDRVLPNKYSTYGYEQPEAQEPAYPATRKSAFSSVPARLSPSSPSVSNPEKNAAAAMEITPMSYSVELGRTEIYQSQRRPVPPPAAAYDWQGRRPVESYPAHATDDQMSSSARYSVHSRHSRQSSRGSRGSPPQVHEIPEDVRVQQQQMERVRQERVRLSKLNELRDEEDSLQARIDARKGYHS